ncbi:MAG: hypothetical protein ACJA1F_000134 [Paracoccaceae bacterium]
MSKPVTCPRTSAQKDKIEELDRLLNAKNVLDDPIERDR